MWNLLLKHFVYRALLILDVMLQRGITTAALQKMRYNFLLRFWRGESGQSSISGGTILANLAAPHFLGKTFILGSRGYCPSFPERSPSDIASATRLFSAVDWATIQLLNIGCDRNVSRPNACPIAAEVGLVEL